MRVNLRSPTSGKYAQPGNRIAGDHIADYEARLDPEVLLLCSLVPSSVLPLSKRSLSEFMRGGNRPMTIFECLHSKQLDNALNSQRRSAWKLPKGLVNYDSGEPSLATLLLTRHASGIRQCAFTIER